MARSSGIRTATAVGLASGALCVLVGTPVLARFGLFGPVTAIGIMILGLVVQLLVVLGLTRGSDAALAARVDALLGTEEVVLSRQLFQQADRDVRLVTRSVDRLTAALNAVFLEISTASKKFNLFSADIQYSGQKLAIQSGDQAAAMDEIRGKADHFQDSMQDLVAGIGRCLEQMERTRERYSELRARTTRAEQRLDPLDQATREARELAAVGQERMGQSSAATSELRVAISGLNERIETMRDRTSRIEGVLRAIQDIAETTHVLATNASIEAARAGSAGRGFAVIAAEIRKLAADSRVAVGEVVEYLTHTAAMIRENAAISERSSAQVLDLEHLSAETGRSLADITERIDDVSQSYETFRRMFAEQSSEITDTIADSERVNDLVEAIGSDIARQAEGSAEIRDTVGVAASTAQAAAHSARVLSQLGTYLRTGGYELNSVVDGIEISEQRFLAGLERSETRTTLLYNLEVYRGDELLGHLGDISPSGLLLFSQSPLPIGVTHDAAIRLPLTFGDLPDVPVRFVPRRVEEKAGFCRVGCSIDPETTRLQGAEIEMIITNYTVTHGVDVADPDAEIAELEDLDRG